MTISPHPPPYVRLYENEVEEIQCRRIVEDIGVERSVPIYCFSIIVHYPSINLYLNFYERFVEFFLPYFYVVIFLQFIIISRVYYFYYLFF